MTAVETAAEREARYAEERSRRADRARRRQGRPDPMGYGDQPPSDDDLSREQVARTAGLSPVLGVVAAVARWLRPRSSGR